MYLINDIKSDNVKIYGTVTKESFELQLSSTEFAKYSVQNNILYRNKVKICENVQDVTFSGGSDIINVTMTINNYTRTSTYKLEPK